MNIDVTATMRDYQSRVELARQGFSDARAENWPLHLDLDINHSCNATCTICYRRTSLRQEEGRMSWELFAKIVNEGEEWGLMSLNLDHGGEPLLHPDLDRYIEYARARGIANVMLHTNAIALTPSLAARIIRAGLTRITFSLDAATAGTYALQRGQGHDFECVRGNIASFLELRNGMGDNRPFVQVSFVITQINQGEQALFREQWGALVDDVHFRQFNDPGLELGSALSMPSPIPGQSLAQHGCPYCTMLNWRLSLRWDGVAFPCCHPHGFLMPVGNVSEQTVHSIWRGEKLRDMVSAHQAGQCHDYPGCRMCLAQSPDYIKFRACDEGRV